ncbi:hypothetical protein JOD45_001511 [Scopulibacillus daqui]|uniref:Uncharacterized protein n=1 Tax=Scopulibacillus daqui TaxID=1469162 RepID=A0ABS2Q0E9_9BACL|nr:hypothetical protein [Scopulibacillus daqui]MBM7645300.1 hypothetical protein [Scopulibacillus daqui]
MRLKKTAEVNFQQLSINNIDTSSGVFIGQIQANGWHSSKKDNYGFGSVSHGKVHDTVQIVIDNDNIDMPVNHCTDNFCKEEHSCPDDQTKKAAGEEDSHEGEETIQQNFQFNDININDSSINSAVAIGENSQNNWHSQTKNNYGIGRFIGEIYAERLAGNINDQDIIDAAACTKNINSLMPMMTPQTIKQDKKEI